MTSYRRIGQYKNGPGRGTAVAWASVGMCNLLLLFFVVFVVVVKLHELYWWRETFTTPFPWRWS